MLRYCLDLNTQLILHGMQQLSDADFYASVKYTSPPGFLVGHILMSRWYWLSRFVSTVPFPEADLFGYRQSFDASRSYPVRTEMITRFTDISRLLRTELEQIPDDTMPIEHGLSIPGQRISDLNQYLIHHESYHVGQFNLHLRRLGLEPGRYRLETQ